MPIYEYVCVDCKNQFEVMRPMRDADAPLACEACGKKHVRRKLSLVVGMSGGQAIAGTSAGCNCGSCSGGNCSSCSN